jgi:signal transduction histidine kinase
MRSVGKSGGRVTSAALAQGRRLVAPSRETLRMMVPVIVLATTTLYVAGVLAVDASERIFLLAFLLYVLIGAAIAWCRPAHPVGWLLIVVGGAVVTSSALDAYAHRAAESDTGEWARWAQNWIYVLGWNLGTTVLLFLLPDGRLPSPRWRWLARGITAAALLSVVVTALVPGRIGEDLPITNPVGVDAWSGALRFADTFLVAVLTAGTVCAVFGIVARWRGASDRERRQLAWVLLGVILALALIGVSAVLGHLGGSELLVVTVVACGLAMPPLGLAIGVLREQLFDIELVLSRTLVYLLFSAVLVATYALALVVASLWFRQQADLAASLVATALMVAALSALRERLQRRIEGVLFGERRRPYDVLARLGTIAERHSARSPLAVDLASELRRALRLDYVGVVCPGTVPVTIGDRPHTVESFDLLCAGRELGALEIGRNQADAAFRSGDRELLETAAARIAASVWADRLTDELQAAREQLVRGREAERVRIRRDLHDGVGAVLAAATLQVDSLRRRLEPGDTAGAELAGQLKAELQKAVKDVRALLEDLRPPNLDAGLVAALTDQSVALRSLGMNVEMTVQGVSSLDPAAEVAAYRIATEAMTNVVRHSGASSILVALRVADGWLELRVEDDGHGMPASVRRGVGTESMQERAAELGGSLEIGRGELGGLAVVARIPLRSP